MKTYAHPILPFGEKLLVRTVPKGKAQARWIYGFWIERSLLANDHLVLTDESGLVRNWSVRRLPIGEAWGLQAKTGLQKMSWTPTSPRID